MKRTGVAYEKPSKYKQWQEKSELPIAARPMPAEEIEYFKTVLAQSYKCRPSDIRYTFSRIDYELDADRDDCLLLEYRIKYRIPETDVIGERLIFTLKIPVSEEIKKRAELLRRTSINSLQKQLKL